ncbi:Rieske (2Fe-2S) protein [Mongoliitalea daihaiensis]|uniref:Rieske (2Fe-2S) protein n=1 Tax=Mongoliitalea daihaiensis TaxID=2782006 RepID=UPI001F35FFF6|nr:Rieske (2Fe-2S) protein [Mongoliitalea daihaiensis]UJP65696.1 Rieske (2Fe-2S) protein [Mongoliitalea daihaiensis]
MKTYFLGRNKSEVQSFLPNLRIQKIKVGQYQLGIVRIEEQIFAFEIQCPHRKADLTQGRITQYEEVVCPLHEYRFDLQTGQVKAGTCPDLKVYACRLLDSGLEVDVPQM